MYGQPDSYGWRSGASGLWIYCGHCGSGPRGHVPNSFGTFCGACCRWIVYAGPDQEFGDGMGLGGPHEAERIIGEHLHERGCRVDLVGDRSLSACRGHKRSLAPARQDRIQTGVEFAAADSPGLDSAACWTDTSSEVRGASMPVSSRSRRS